MLESVWSCFEVILELFWSYFGVMLELFSNYFEKRDNVFSYKDEVEKEMTLYCKNLITKNVKKDIQIFSCKSY